MKQQPINLMLLDGGLGDHVASLVAVDYIIRHYPQVKPKVWAPDYLVELAKNLLPPSEIYDLSQMNQYYDRDLPTKTTKWDGYTSPMKIHCLDYAFLRLCDENPSIRYKNYLKINTDGVQIPKLPEKYVVFTVAYTAEVREWLPKFINETAAHCKAEGYTPVFLGKKEVKTGILATIKGEFKEEIDFSLGINLIDQTSLVQAAAIMDDAYAVVGVDNGLLHLAGCTDAYIVGGFTTVSPNIRMPVRNNELGWRYHPVTPDALLACSFCQERTNFLYGHDYRNCMFGKTAPGHKLCVKQMNSKKFILGLGI